MGVIEHLTDLATRRNELIRDYFEPHLTRLGLSISQIENQNIDELNESLEKVNDAISHPDSFGTLNIRMTPSVGLVIAAGPAEAHINTNILPLLLERKSLILSRIKTIVGERKIDSLQALVATVADPQLRKDIEDEISLLAKQSQRLAEQESTVAQVQAEQIAVRDQALAKLQTEIFERRLRAWTGFFARESMATYIGAFLLVILTFVHIATMFIQVARPTEVVTNSYLLILGYFFGQSVTRNPARQVEGKEGL